MAVGFPLAETRYRDAAWLRIRLETYLAENLGRDVSVHDFRRISNGFSWITWTFALVDAHDTSRRDLVFRIGPPDGLQAPYSAKREASMLRLLDSSDVPVPDILFSSDDTTLFGAPFIVCERMCGTALTPWTIKRDDADTQALAPIARQFIHLLTAIHRTPWVGTKAAEQVGSVDAQTVAIDQLCYWEHRYRKVQMECLPILEWALHELKDHAPVAPKVVLLHGDYRIGNFLTQAGNITAVLDWEMCHFGDPHEDLAWALYPPFGLPTLMTAQDVYAQYSADTGIAVSEQSLAYYAAFNLLKMTVINLTGLHSFANGSDDTRLAVLGFLTASHLAQLQKAIGEVS